MNTPTRNTQWIEAISVLIELTQQGKLKWQASPSGLAGLINSPNPFMTGGNTASYTAKYQDKWFRLRKGEPGATSSTHFSGGGLIGGILAISYSLEIIDASGNLLYSVPENTGLSDLYQAVQYQLSGVDQVLESLLKERQK